MADHSVSMEELSILWEKALEERDFDGLKQVLCLVQYSKEMSTLSVDLFVQTLHLLQGQKDSDPLILLTLGASWRPVIVKSQKTGERISLSFMESLKKLLFHKNPEVLEWTLRTIDQLGGESIWFKDAIIKIRPGWGRFFNKNKRASFQIIDMLSRRWSHCERLDNR